MAQELTILTRTIAAQQTKTPNLVLKIDGIDLIFGYIDLMKSARYGEDGIMFGDPGLVYGGATTDENSRDYVILEKSSNNITQQLLQDKGAASSVSNVKIALIDVNDSLTALFQPGATLDDILGRDAEVYMIFNGTRFPDDAISIFFGILSDIDFGAGNCILNIAHPDQLKKQEIFTKAQTNLTASIDASQTTLDVEVAADFLLPVDTFKTYLKIDEEIIEYTGITSNQFTGLVRGSLNTIADTHDDEAEVESLYSVTDNAIALALKMMLSNPDEPIGLAGIEFASLADIPLNDGRREVGDNTLAFSGTTFNKNGVGVGDTIYVTFQYDGTDYELPAPVVITQIDTIGGNVILTTTDDLFFLFDLDIPTNRAILASPGFIDVVSRYNVWPDGLRMKMKHVDLIQHQNYLTLFNSSYPEMTVYLKDTVEGKSVIERDFYYPNGLYALPRGGKSSVGMTLPPLAQFETINLDESNVTNLAQLSIKRSLNKNFYNSVVYRYNEDSLEDKFLNGRVTVSQESINRIPIKNNPLKVEARGLRDDEITSSLIDRQSVRFLDRYKYGTEYIANVEVLVGDGFNIEVGDVVVFGSPGMKLSDSSTGTRNFSPRLFEVVNRSLNIKTGKLSLSLLNTSFSLDGRYGVVSPSSNVVSSSAGKIEIAPSFSNTATSELFKWQPYIGLNLLVHSEDWSTQETVTLRGIDPTNVNTLLVEGMTVTPMAGWILDVAHYGSGNSQENALLKRLHCYFNPQEEVDTGTSGTIFSVIDETNLFVGALIRVHNSDYSIYSPQVEITDITGTTITVGKTLGFTPASGQLIELIGFASDNGQPYLYI
jgi:hypothetical protein